MKIRILANYFNFSTTVRRVCVFSIYVYMTFICIGTTEELRVSVIEFFQLLSLTFICHTVRPVSSELGTSIIPNSD